METSLLSTKLFIPPLRPGLVNRPRLLEKLQALLNHSLTVVSAPAGFGKTTLVVEWIRSCRPSIPTAWLSLDPADNDPIRFWDYFIEATRAVYPRAGETARAFLFSPEPVPIESVLTSLINDLASVSQDFILVLDDYHFIESETVHKAFNFLIEHQPPEMHSIIATRVNPPLPLAHLRGKGSLLEIRADDLRFTLEEADRLLKALHCPALAVEEIRALHERTEGWAVGLKMAAFSLPGEKDVSSFVARFSGSQRYVMDYLVEEVLQKQAPEVKDFLSQTSILGKLSGSLCNAVTGKDNGQDILVSLEKANLFIVPLDDKREWYRYEHLFAELLRHRLEVERGEENVGKLQTKASQWFEDCGLVEEAVEQSLEAFDWKRVVRLLAMPDTFAEYDILSGHGKSLFKWLQRIPEESLLDEPRLYCQYVWSLAVLGQLNRAESCLKTLEDLTAADFDTQGRIIALKSYMCNAVNDFRHAEEYARQAMALLPQGDATVRGSVYECLASICASSGRLEEAESLAKESYRIKKTSGNRLAAISPLKSMGTVKFLKGELHQAEALLMEALEIAEQHPDNISTLTMLGLVCWLWNDLESAADYLERSIESAKVSVSVLARGPYLMAYAYTQLAQVRIAQGNNEDAVRILQQCDQLTSENETVKHMRARIAASHIYLAVAQEDSEGISKWIDELAEYEEYIPFLIRPDVLRRFYARKGDPAQEEQAAYERYSRNGLVIDMIWTRIGQALTSKVPAEAIAFLAEALTTARPEGIIRIFADEGMPLAPLLKEAISRGVEPEFAGKLLTIIQAEEHRKRQRMSGKETIISPLSGLLSERELEVLGLMAAGRSNPEIAAQLIVSLNTTKTHVRHVLEKLNARSRMEAINRAKELKLL